VANDDVDRWKAVAGELAGRAPSAVRSFGVVDTDQE
jgi:hypothetical protein